MAVFHWGPSPSLCGSPLQLLCPSCILLWGPVGLACSSTAPVSATTHFLLPSRENYQPRALSDNRNVTNRRKDIVGWIEVEGCGEICFGVVFFNFFCTRFWQEGICVLYTEQIIWKKKNQTPRGSQGYCPNFHFTHSFRLKVNPNCCINLSLILFLICAKKEFCACEHVRNERLLFSFFFLKATPILKIFEPDHFIF